jgi:hypothetical protein
MSSKRPIKAFYVPKRNVSQNSARQLISNSPQVLPLSPSFTYIDGIHSPYSAPYTPIRRLSVLSDLSQREYSLNSSSKLSVQETFLSKSNLKDTDIPKNKNDDKNRKKCLAIIIALFIAACLIAIVILLAVILTKNRKEFF